MNTSTAKFTSQIDGSITATIYNSSGAKQVIAGCTITLRIANEFDDVVLLEKPMTINENNEAVAELTPTDTNMLIKGNYQIQLIIIDVLGKKNATEKQTIFIDDILGD